MMEEKWERVGEETSLQHMHFKKKKNKKEKWAPRAYLFSFPMWLKMTMVAFNLPSKLSQMVAFNLPSKLSQMVAFKVQSLFQALQSPYGSLQYSFQALQSPFNLLKN
jgi:hypothetical protein